MLTVPHAHNVAMRKAEALRTRAKMLDRHAPDAAARLRREASYIERDLHAAEATRPRTK